MPPSSVSALYCTLARPDAHAHDAFVNATASAPAVLSWSCRLGPPFSADDHAALTLPPQAFIHIDIGLRPSRLISANFGAQIPTIRVTYAHACRLSKLWALRGLRDHTNAWQSPIAASPTTAAVPTPRLQSYNLCATCSAGQGHPPRQVRNRSLCNGPRVVWQPSSRLVCASFAPACLLRKGSIKDESIDGILVHCNPGPNAGTTTTGYQRHQRE
ncbi:hypothetical protein PCL_11850 [Purpureocillium lilacinum]|uniref:Uncharacterized protein n=1 Tax=Purpureocillium lilacinum TaxID=33203 RepID=A0A2U3EB71_PURLI|nr:hypothetical protein PCL_11850 [Purpureocillium lilacinum]